MDQEDYVEIVEEEEIRIDRPYLIIGLPDIGLVGTISSMHLVNAQEMRNIGHIESNMLPPVIFLHKGKISDPIRIYSHEENRILLITSEIPIPPDMIRPLSRKIVEWAKNKNVEAIILLGGIPTQNRMNIEKPTCFTIITHDKLEEAVEKLNLKRLSEGIMVGPYSLILREAMKRNVPAIALMTQSYPTYPDPGAAAVTIEILNRLLDINIDIEKLLKEAEDIRVKTRDLMRRTSIAMRHAGKSQEMEVPAMYV